ncbi:unnamed protein product [Parajaminaea phylloscopi]
MPFSGPLRLAVLAALPLLALTAPSASSPLRQRPFSYTGGQAQWDPLEHMSGIAPYHDAPGADVHQPPGCEIAGSAYMVRHGAIGGNDEEFDEYMRPFKDRIERFQESGASFKRAGPLAFLKDWKSPVTDDTVEVLTRPGEKDAEAFGKRLRKLYPDLFPPKDLGVRKSGRRQPKVSFKIWSASSSRDVATSKAFIRGCFPKHHEGEDGEGDGKYVQLVKVPNKDPDWQASLTPHKVCPKWSKEAGKPDFREWLGRYGPQPLERLKELLPDFDWQLEDIVAMQMYCGYETVMQGKSDFCKQGLFTEDEFRAFGYAFDLFYHRIVGYGSPMSPYLGMPWVNVSTHNLLAIDEPQHPHSTLHPLKSRGGLPDPSLPPNATHTQKMFVYFSHREEPPLVLVALGIWNQTAAGGLPLDRIPEREQYLWQTSHVLPFLGHVALQRLECGDHAERPGSFVRIVVNGAAQKLPRPELADGPGNSCELSRFSEYVQERASLYSDFQTACASDSDATR